MPTDLSSIVAAMAGGLLPALAWLWFWLREDSAHPEPRRLITLAFLAGMASVIVVIPIEQYVAGFIIDNTLKFSAWSAIEEITKFSAALVVVLWQKDNDEPIDAAIYMITVALGFAGAENALFLLSPISGGTVLQTIITGNLRFVGATLLHVISSATIGVALGVSFYKSRFAKASYVTAGLILAIVLHSSFNFLILNTPENQILRTFVFVWCGVIVLLAVLEYVKRVHPLLTGKR
jgi:RsiW-degrading membrane proteinase PrsW (M82 family)